jgi:hypothetical protein
MKLLLYCILFKDQAAVIEGVPDGIESGSPRVIESNGLGAVVSVVPENTLPADTSAILAYHRVIEWFHNHCDVIPLRFGAVVDDEAEVERLLDRHGQRYETMLKELAGCAEMGVRIIGATPTPTEPCGYSGGSSLNYTGNGARYLAERKARHDTESLAVEHFNNVIAQYRSRFEGMFINFKSEISKSTSVVGRHDSFLVSLYFLVPKESVEEFRNIYAKLKLESAFKILMSGPWPPYNFVLPDDY